jgi:hypothetical protein
MSLKHFWNKIEFKIATLFFYEKQPIDYVIVFRLACQTKVA